MIWSHAGKLAPEPRRGHTPHRGEGSGCLSVESKNNRKMHLVRHDYEAGGQFKWGLSRYSSNTLLRTSHPIKKTTILPIMLKRNLTKWTQPSLTGVWSIIIIHKSIQVYWMLFLELMEKIFCRTICIVPLYMVNVGTVKRWSRGGGDFPVKRKSFVLSWTSNDSYNL